MMEETSEQHSQEQHEQKQEGRKTLIRTLREQKGLTRPQVRNTIGVSERRQADWENGNAKPDLENLAALARFYGVSLKTILEGLGIDVSGIPDD